MELSAGVLVRDRLEPLNGAPLSVVPVNCMRSSASADGEVLSTNAASTATIAAQNVALDRT